MSVSVPLFTSHAGITHHLRWEDDGSLHVDSLADVSDILEANKAMANHNDGYSPTRELRRVASIPLALVWKIRNEEGWDPLDAGRYQERIKRLLNDSDWRHLRTAPGRL